MLARLRRYLAAHRERDEDWCCLSCGYLLRGLSGDPIRCPECGHLNQVDELRALHSRQFRQGKTTAMVAVITLSILWFGESLVDKSWNLPVLPALIGGLALAGLLGCLLVFICLTQGMEKRWRALLACQATLLVAFGIVHAVLYPIVHACFYLVDGHKLLLAVAVGAIGLIAAFGMGVVGFLMMWSWAERFLPRPPECQSHDNDKM